LPGWRNWQTHRT